MDLGAAVGEGDVEAGEEGTLEGGMLMIRGLQTQL